MRKFEVLKTYAELAWARYKEFKTKDATGAQIGAFDNCLCNRCKSKRRF